MGSVFDIALATWFIWLPIFSVLIFLDTWFSYIHRLFLDKVNWVVLEVHIPREIRRGPKAMEQIFATLYNFIGAPDQRVTKYWEGDVLLWFSFEIASFGGELHFYIRTPAQFRNMIEANIYAYYPDLEVREVEDYISHMPESVTSLHAANYEMWGSELELSKEDAYPIRTYPDFDSMDEYSQIDPISSLIEMLSKLQAGEQIWLQMLVAPATDDWKKKGEALVKKIEKEGKEKTIVGDAEITTSSRTPGQVEVMKAIERNIAKPGFQTLIRWVYVAPKAIYNNSVAKSGVPSAFNQYRIQNLNSFKHNWDVRTDTNWYSFPFLFPKKRLETRRRFMWKKYRERHMPLASFFTHLTTSKTIAPSVFVLNTEELATVYHYPSNLVLTGPVIKRVESKKVGAPAGLPIFKDAESLEGFKEKG